MEALSSEISTVEIVWLAEYMEILGRVAKAYDFCRSIGVGLGDSGGVLRRARLFEYCSVPPKRTYV